MRIKFRLLSAFAVLSVATVCVLFWLLFRNSPTAFAPLPNPNGYEMLVAAAAKLPRLPDFEGTNRTDEIAIFIRTNQIALAELRRALDFPGAVTVEMNENWLSRHSREMMKLKAAALILDTQAEFLQREGSNSMALAVALDGVRLGASAQNEGTFIDYLVGSACELIAVSRLTNLLTTIDADSCKRAQTQLERVDQERGSFSKLAGREAEWSWRTFGPVKRLNMMIQSRSLHPSREWEQLMPDTAEEFRKRTTFTRLAILRTATRRYELDHGAAPTKMPDLVPSYLSTPLTNLTTGAALQLP